MPGGGHADSGLTHLVYDSRDEYVVRSVAFLRDGLSAGEGAVVANTRPGLSMMREALGADSGSVAFTDVSTAYTRPSGTLAVCNEIYVGQLRKTPALRAVADVQFGGDPGDWGMWTAYGAVFNRTFRHLPAWILCTYNANGLPGPVLDGVWRTHTRVLHSGSPYRSGISRTPTSCCARPHRSRRRWPSGPSPPAATARRSVNGSQAS
jgi:hypothetical protein